MTAPGSVNAAVRRLSAEAHVVVIEVEPGGVVARHPAGGAQLFVVVRGVRLGERRRRPSVNRSKPAQAVLWEPGEEHESGSDEGMTVLVVEAESLDL